MFQLSVCEGTVFPNLPFQQRVREIAAAGFSIELWGWEDQALDAIAADPMIHIASMPGWGPGSMVHPDGVNTFLDGAKKNLTVAQRIGCRNLAIATGELNRKGQVVHAIAEHPADVWITAYRCLCQLAEVAEKQNIFYNFEVLNTKVDHARYPFPKLEDGARLIRQVGSPRVRLLVDVYHVQVEEGNIIQGIRDYRELIGHIHVADVPGRHEPGTGEIHYPRVADALREIGYTGIVGLEAFPKSDDHLALERFRQTFAEAAS
jgi:hydroxypyruvate isomerase